MLDKLSVATGIYVAWERRLQDNVADLFIPKEARDLLRGIQAQYVRTGTMGRKATNTP